ncbi:MAG TPA: hypothetical protein VGH20_06740 [Myxococcales bacterium]|jgi:hypothetical protein
MKLLSIRILLAVGLVGGTARAEATQADLAEAGAPDSVLNQDGYGLQSVDSAVTDAQVLRAEAGSPHSVGNASRMIVAGDPNMRACDMHLADLAEAGAPDSLLNKDGYGRAESLDSVDAQALRAENDGGDSIGAADQPALACNMPVPGLANLHSPDSGK